MRSVPVVVPHKFGQHRPQVLFVQHDDVVQAFSTQCPDDTFHDRVRTRRSNGRSDGIDADALGTCAEVAAIDGISISEQVAWLVAQGVASISWRHTQAAVGLAVTFTCISSRRPCAMKTRTYSVLKVRVGTVSRSAAQR